ncbi:MAG: aminopeptidase P family protein [Clostridia bacterium]|nr:aminopeptidase P family protein [Clostridia bacterium]
MKQRIEKVRKILKEKQLDGVIITSRPNTLYLTQFPGSASLVYISMEKAVFMTDFRYIEFSRDTCGAFYDVMMYTAKPFEFLYDIISKDGIRTIGFEDGDVSYSSYQSITSQLKDIKLVGIQTELDLLRTIKYADEIEKIKKAVQIADDAFTHILKYIEVGISEIDIATEIEYFMRKSGAMKPSFDSIVASGKRSSLPHGQATEKLIEDGDAITMDFGALYDGYCSDMTRTVFIGKPEKKILSIYDIVLEAQCRSEEAVQKGRTGVEVDKVARDIIYKAGYEGMFGHGLGHGVGIMVHENPRLAVSAENILENGMVVTVEPGIYVPDFGGVRIEDMVIVNDDVPIVLTTSTKELIIL